MGQGFPPCPVVLLPRNGFALMKSMNIAASSDLVSRLYSHRRVVALGDTDLRTSRQSSLPLRIVAVAFLRCLSAPVSSTGVFVLNMLLNYLRSVTAVISGNEQQWLELESAACPV